MTTFALVSYTLINLCLAVYGTAPACGPPTLALPLAVVAMLASVLSTLISTCSSAEPSWCTRAGNSSWRTGPAARARARFESDGFFHSAERWHPVCRARAG